MKILPVLTENSIHAVVDARPDCGWMEFSGGTTRQFAVCRHDDDRLPKIGLKRSCFVRQNMVEFRCVEGGSYVTERNHV